MLWEAYRSRLYLSKRPPTSHSLRHRYSAFALGLLRPPSTSCLRFWRLLLRRVSTQSAAYQSPAVKRIATPSVTNGAYQMKPLGSSVPTRMFIPKIPVTNVNGMYTNARAVIRVAARACSALADANSAEIAACSLLSVACWLPSVACWTLTELISIWKLSMRSFSRVLARSKIFLW